jgi:hypothetical protein
MADRYWRGGTAAWDGTAGSKWAATAGGPTGETVPTTADDVFFDAASTGTCTISSGNTGAKSINCTGFTGTLALATGVGITVAGSVTLVAGMTYSPGNASFTFTGTGTLTTAGKTFSGVTVNGSGITLTLGDALNIATRALVITAGSFDTANYNVTSANLSSSNSNTRTVTLGSSTLTLSAGSPFDFSNPTNLTFNANTSQINLSNASANFNGGSQTFYNVSFTSTSAGTRVITGANTFNNLTLNASATGLTQLSIDSNQTVNGTFTCAGSSATARGFVRSNTIGTTRTITAATLSANDCDFRDITIAGGAAGTAPTRAGDCGGNSGITFPAAKTVYRVGTNTTWAGSSSWALNSGDTGSNDNYPLAQDTAVIDNNTTLTGTLNLTIYNIGTLDCSTRTTGITLNHNAAAIRYGSYTLGSGVTVSGTTTQIFSGRGTMTFTSAGKTITFYINVVTPNGTFELGDAFSGSNTIELTQGTFDAVTYNLTCTTFDSANSNTRTLTMGSGLWTLSGTGTVWNLGIIVNLTFNKDTADILLSDTSTTSRTFIGGGLTYNKLTIGGATGTSTTIINGANTFSELASTKTVAHTIRLDSSLTIGTWSVTGTAGNVVTLNSNTAGSFRTLTKSGGGFLTGIDYLNIRDVVGSPVSDTWYIGSNSVYNTTAPNTARGFFLTQRADNAIVVLDSTSSSTWTVPSDWNNSSNTIHLIGGGGGGAGCHASADPNRAAGGGGGGGGYTQLTNQTLTTGASITYQVGSAGSAGSANFNGTAGGTTSWNSGAATAGGGGGGQVTSTTSTGGTAGTGSTYNGGVGGVGSTSTAASTGNGGGGGAGAAGPNGAGGNGGNGFGSTTATNIAGGGGGGNGGGTNGGNASAATGGTGGNNSLGTGGGASNTSGVNGGGGGGSVSSNSAGGIGIEIFGTGSGGGGGGIDDAARTNTGGLYGAGGGGGGGGTAAGTQRSGSAGAQGAIIIVYTPGGAAPSPTGNMFFMFN